MSSIQLQEYVCMYVCMKKNELRKKINRAVARSENLGGLHYCGGHNLPPWLR